MIPSFLDGVGGARAPSRRRSRALPPQAISRSCSSPGYGGRPPADTMTFDALAADVEASIAKSALEKPVLVGHSMGGMVVQTLLRRWPDGYRAAVLSCTSPAFGNPAGDFQKKFVADRLAPLDAGKTMAGTPRPAQPTASWRRRPIRPDAHYLSKDTRRCRSGPIAPR